MRIYDTGTGEAMPKDDFGYAYCGGYQASARPVAEDIGSTADGLAIPIGIYNS